MEADEWSDSLCSPITYRHVATIVDGGYSTVSATAPEGVTMYWRNAALRHGLSLVGLTSPWDHIRITQP